MSKPLVSELAGNVGRGDGAEQLAVFAGFAGEHEHHRFELGNEFLRLGFLRGGTTRGGCLHLLDDSLVRQGGLQRQLAGQQEVAAVAVGHLDYIAAVAQVGYVFFQDHFHFDISKVASSTLSLATVR